jgi:predicted TPR repeat methyltransferase
MNEYSYNENANQYDKQVKEYDSYGHNVIFGMSYEYVKPDEKLLDLGIGTGLASIQFSKAGLKVYGIDSSDEMLEAARSKGFAEELKQYNLSGERIPYNDNFFEHVISCGVFHFLGNLSNLFAEVARVTKKHGIFAFTYAPGEDNLDFGKGMTAWGVPIFKHSSKYIRKLLIENDMFLLKEQRLLIKGADKTNYDMLFSVIIAEHR